MKPRSLQPQCPRTIDLADGVARIQQILDGHEHWVFVVASRQSAALAQAVLERHYTGDRAKGYAAVGVPIGTGLAVVDGASG